MPHTTHTPKQAHSLFAQIAGGLHDKLADKLEKACVIIETEAKRVIGTYDYGWPPLQPATIASKGADTPLLETGELRDSIEHYVDRQKLLGFVGSNNPKAVWQELGTVTIPPRSFLMGAIMRKEQEIKRMIGVEIHADIVNKMRAP